MHNRIEDDDNLVLLYLSGENEELKARLIALGETEETAQQMIDEMDD